MNSDRGRWSGSLRTRRAGAVLCFALALPLTARGEPPAPSVGVASTEVRAEAQRFFEHGLALLDAGDTEHALEAFLRSRALAPGKGNTTNAAHCLHELGRYDEALELYDDLVARFAGELSADNRRRLVPAMQDLLGHVATLAVSSNVDGSVIVDGRLRGKLPLSGPLRVQAGQRVVRVVKDGYATFETFARLDAGKALHIDAVLVPLAEAGQLRLEDPDEPGADAFVDRVRVGTLPWEGTLGPGEHLVWAAGRERGSAPTRAIVVQGQAATLRLHARPLGAAVDISLEPPSAELRVDGVTLGAGGFQGRLPIGTHEILASEPGYVARASTFTVSDGAAGSHVVLKLDVDPGHPRWPRRPIAQITFQAFGAIASGPGLHGDAETWCASSCSSSPRTLGGLVGARVGLRFPGGLGVEAVAGYLRLSESLARSRAVTFASAGTGHPLTYRLTDDIDVSGALVGGVMGHRARLGGRVAFVSRVTVGAVVGSATDPTSGTASTPSGSAPVLVTDRGQRVGATLFVVEPELDLEVEIGPVHVGAGLGVAAFFAAPPRFEHSLVEVSPTGCSLASPGAPACAPASAVIASEAAFRPFGVLVPTLSIGRAF